MLTTIALDSAEDTKDKIQAACTLVAMDAANQKDEHLIFQLERSKSDAQPVGAFLPRGRRGAALKEIQYLFHFRSEYLILCRRLLRDSEVPRRYDFADFTVSVTHEDFATVCPNVESLVHFVIDADRTSRCGPIASRETLSKSKIYREMSSLRQSVTD